MQIPLLLWIYVGISIPPVCLHFFVFILCCKKPTKTITEILYMLVSIIDTIYISYSWVYLRPFFGENAQYQKPSVLEFVIFSITYGESALMTTTLTVTRALVISNPFRRIQKRKVMTITCGIGITFASISSLAIFISYHAHGNFKIGLYINLSIVVGYVIVCTISTVLLIRSLTRSEVQLLNTEILARNHRVSVTVICIAVAFVVTNSTGFIAFVLTKPDEHTRFIIRMFSFMLNAAFNPIIYILLVYKCFFRCCGLEVLLQML